MELGQFVSSEKTTIVIQVNPQVTQNAVVSDDGRKTRGSYHSTALTGFFKAQPKALGTVQILIGVMFFLIGIVFTVEDRFHPLIVLSGITYWGSLIYISAGSLSVAAQNKLHPCVVKASLGMNVISALTAVTAIFLMSIDFNLHAPFHDCEDFHFRYHRFEILFPGITGILLVFSILQFFISICISGFACKASCNRDSTVVNVALNQGN